MQDDKYFNLIFFLLRMQKKTLLFIMVFLGLLGLLTSLYLVQHHYALAQESHFCDFSKTVSCTVISQSAYAELFHMPVALYGVFWFIVFLTIVFFVWRKKHSVKKALLLWSSTGVLFIFYLFYAEWRVGAICPWCTLVHLIVLLLFSLTLLLYRRK
ncbi:hypothetical protein A2300_03945 [Candidatus Falkowbacteria bacterium RIFOXYB2_FULL_35_7]|nr:MAG: hypothetical protein A2300_03945 [Candidatus Falkowbacteria bacterium RIFOXYB2_FULL_35_7]